MTPSFVAASSAPSTSAILPCRSVEVFKGCRKSTMVLAVGSLTPECTTLTVISSAGTALSGTARRVRYGSDCVAGLMQRPELITVIVSSVVADMAAVTESVNMHGTSTNAATMSELAGSLMSIQHAGRKYGKRLHSSRLGNTPTPCSSPSRSISEGAAETAGWYAPNRNPCLLNWVIGTVCGVATALGERTPAQPTRTPIRTAAVTVFHAFISVFASSGARVGTCAPPGDIPIWPICVRCNCLGVLTAMESTIPAEGMIHVLAIEDTHSRHTFAALIAIRDEQLT